MTFSESPRFPDTVSEGAIGGPVFNTHVYEGYSGVEQRGVAWRRPRHTYKIDFGIRTDDDMYDVREFFMSMKGRLTGFRYKDWSDFELSAETIGTGDGSTTEFQITKTYTSGALSFVRNIFKIVASTVTVTVNSVEVTEGVDYTVNYNTGVITFSVAPTNTHAIAVTCEFDVPVRLDSEQMESTHSGYNVQEWGQITLIELVSI
jgi:uncharacterized protein (TIGR02217 family)